MFNKLESVLMPIADKLGKNRVLIAIRDGFLITTPLLIGMLPVCWLVFQLC